MTSETNMEKSKLLRPLVAIVHFGDTSSTSICFIMCVKKVRFYRVNPFMTWPLSNPSMQEKLSAVSFWQKLGLEEKNWIKINLRASTGGEVAANFPNDWHPTKVVCNFILYNKIIQMEVRNYHLLTLPVSWGKKKKEKIIPSIQKNCWKAFCIEPP